MFLITKILFIKSTYLGVIESFVSIALVIKISWIEPFKQRVIQAELQVSFSSNRSGELLYKVISNSQLKFSRLKKATRKVFLKDAPKGEIDD